MQQHNITLSSLLGLITLATASISAPLCADAPSSSKQKPAYDADLFNKDKKIFFVNAEFLYWLVNEGAVDYAVKMNHPAWSTTQSTYAIGKYHSASFDWSPGFRLNFGYFNAPHYWDSFLQYTYVPSSGTRHVSQPSAFNEYLNGTWAQPDAGTTAVPSPLSRASAHIDLQYNVLDFLFSRRFQTNEHLRINLYGGLTSAIIFQKLKVSYEDTLGVHAEILNRWRFEGLGLRIGSKVDWYMGSDVFLTGSISTGALSGWYKNSAYERTDLTLANVNNTIPILDTHFKDYRLAYTAQLFLGPSWQKRFKSIRTEVVAGYEFTIWNNLHEIRRTGAGGPTATKQTYINDSNVSLQGLTVRVNVDF